MYKNWDCNTKGHANKSLAEETYRTEDGKDIRFRTSLWGCVYCDATSTTRFPDLDDQDIDHTKCGGEDVCFGCKAKGLQLATGDAAGNVVASGTTQKKWDKELAFYKEARAQGVQPAGTSRDSVQKALEASEVINKPYNAEKMPEAKYITPKTAEVMKEVGAI
jgi:hypothetical protein